MKIFLLKALITTSFVLPLASAQAAQPLQVKVYNADANSFGVDSTLITGEKDALLIDAGFTRADALRIAANVLDSGKELKIILVSQADPDYYFGVETLLKVFPNAQVVAPTAVLEKIKSTVQGKVAFWGPQMGANAPKNPLLPTALTNNSLTVDGEKVEVRGTQGALAYRPYVWIPSIKTIAGNIGVFGNMHVWTADTQTTALRSAWVAQLDEMSSLNPTMVVPGHMKAGTAMNASTITFTKNYLQAFEKNLASSKNSAELIEKMKVAYPDIAGAANLELGAKVNKGEMKW